MDGQQPEAHEFFLGVDFSFTPQQRSFKSVCCIAQALHALFIFKTYRTYLFALVDNEPGGFSAVKSVLKHID